MRLQTVKRACIFWNESDISLLDDTFEIFRKICSEIYQLDPTRFFSTPGLAWQATLKKTKVELQLSTDIDLLFIVEKEIRGGKCCSVNRYAKANNKYMKNYDKNQ